MKVLVIGHAYTAAVNRTKWTTLAALHPGITIQVIVPELWPDTLFTVRANDIAADNTENCTFVALKTKHAGNEPKHMYRWRDLIRILRAFSPDIIHVEQGTLAMSHWQVSLLARIWAPRAKLIFFTWINWQEPRTWRYWLRWGLIERSNLSCSHGAVVGNVAAQGILHTKGFTKPVAVIPQLGADLQRYRSMGGMRNKIVLFVGRIVPEKGVLVLAQAFARVAAQFPEWKLQYVGGGPAACELGDLVIPSVPHEHIPAMLNIASILVLPSYDTPQWKEQFGLVLAEAMACRLPVIGSSAGAIPEVIGDAGLVFEQKNVDDLVRCLQLLMGDESLREKLSEAGYQRAQEKLSRQAIARQTVAFWQSLL